MPERNVQFYKDNSNKRWVVGKEPVRDVHRNGFVLNAGKFFENHDFGERFVNPSQLNVPFLYPLKMSENLFL